MQQNRIVFDGTYWVVEGMTKPSVSDLEGSLPFVSSSGEYTTDCNDCTTSGYYMIDTYDISNDPASELGLTYINSQINVGYPTLVVENCGGGVIYQRFHAGYYESTQSACYFKTHSRYGANGSWWTPWQQKDSYTQVIV